MTYKMQDGAFVKNDNGAFERIDYIDELVQSCAMVLKCPLAGVYTDKDYGIRFSLGSSFYGSPYNLYNVRQSLSGINGVFVESVVCSGDKAVINILINHHERQVTIKI